MSGLCGSAEVTQTQECLCSLRTNSHNPLIALKHSATILGTVLILGLATKQTEDAFRDNIVSIQRTVSMIGLATEQIDIDITHLDTSVSASGG